MRALFIALLTLPSSLFAATIPSAPPSELHPIVLSQRSESAEYRTVDIDNLSSHINKKARVTLYNGKIYQGTLGTVTNWRIRLLIRKQGGSMSYPIKIGDIRNVEVFD